MAGFTSIFHRFCGEEKPHTKPKESISCWKYFPQKIAVGRWLRSAHLRKLTTVLNKNSTVGLAPHLYKTPPSFSLRFHPFPSSSSFSSSYLISFSSRTLALFGWSWKIWLASKGTILHLSPPCVAFEVTLFFFFFLSFLERPRFFNYTGE